MHFERQVAMPNHIFKDLKKWLNDGELLSPHHQEFVYAYYWLIAYLWRYAKYGEKGFTTRDIKQILGYNPDEKRINYIIKSSGLLDRKQYTKTVEDFPVLWKLEHGELTLTMFSDFKEEHRSEMYKFKSGKAFVKAPMLSLGKRQNGLYWHSEDSHTIRGDVFVACMNNPKLSCAGFYVYGILLNMRNKNVFFNNQAEFGCTNETLMQLTGWGLAKVKRVTDELKRANLIVKQQKKKQKGKINSYQIL